MRRQRLDAHRGLGRQHRHSHPRRARLPQPAALRAGRRPWPAPPLIRRQRSRATSKPSTPTSTASRSSSSPPTSRSRTRCRRSPCSRSPPSKDANTCGSRSRSSTGYRVELPDEEIWLDLESAPDFEIGPNTVPRWVEMQGVVGSRRARARRGPRVPPPGGRLRAREAHPRYAVQHRRRQATLAVPQTGADVPGLDRAEGRDRRGLQPRLPDDDHRGPGRSGREGLERDHAPGRQPPRAAAADDQPLRPRGLDRRRRLPTRASATVPTEKSEVSHVTLDGKDGNTWEQLLAAELELNKNVEAYVKNDHLGFTIPYVHKGRTHSYIPDFLVRLRRLEGRGLRSNPDRRSLRKPEEPWTDPGEGNNGATTRGAPRSTTTAASAAGATSR